MQRLLGKVCIITGGGSGIGLATVNRFLEYGAKAAVLDLNPLEPKDGSSQISIKCDVTDQDQVDHAVKTVLQKWSKIDIIVNNAGLTDHNAPVHEMSNDMWRRIMSVNLDGPMFLMRAAIPHMLRNTTTEKGCIINVCSISSFKGASAGCAYTASKHGLLGLTRSTAWMYRKDGIRCNAVMPGATMTNIMANSNLPPDQQPPPRLADFLNLMPGICSADDIAEGIIFLANSQSANGAELVIDKGWTTG